MHTVPVQLRAKSDAAGPGFYGRHEFADRVEHDLELGVVLLLHLSQLEGEILMGSQHLTQLHERSHDLDVDLDCTLAL